MTVKEIIEIGGETMYQVVDATVVGSRVKPKYLHIGADRNYVGKEFGDMEVVEFEITRKNYMTLFVK